MSTPIIAPSGAHVLRNVQLEIDGDDYGPANSTAVFTPSATVVRFPGLAPEGRLSETTEPDWTLDLTFVQDWSSEKSLSKLLLSRKGEKVPVKFKPRRGAGLPAFTSDVTLATGGIGGPSDQFPTSTVSMGCSEPVLDSDDDPITPEPEYGV